MAQRFIEQRRANPLAAKLGQYIHAPNGTDVRALQMMLSRKTKRADQLIGLAECPEDTVPGLAMGPDSTREIRQGKFRLLFVTRAKRARRLLERLETQRPVSGQIQFG